MSTPFSRTPKTIPYALAEARSLLVCGMTVNNRELLMLCIEFKNSGEYCEVWYARYGDALKRCLYNRQAKLDRMFYGKE